MFDRLPTRSITLGRGLARGLVVCLACLTGCAATGPSSPHSLDQATFSDPESAAKALLAAAERGDHATLESILGTDAHELLSSGDAVADRNQLEVFVVAMRQHWSLDEQDAESRELVIGHERWPFPIPIVKDRRGWWFDTAAGRREILARRIGRNELAAIGALRTAVVAQLEYAAEGHDGAPAGAFARRIRSSPGRHDGLYWPELEADAPPSPLGAFAAAAAVEGYGAAPEKGPQPYHGYRFRILTRAGPRAPGGACDYVVDGRMTGGFALLAYPVEYGSSGIMTFVVGPDGVVRESDLGEHTARIAGAIEAYDPDDEWYVVD